jgi:hypothetical protein
MTPNQSARATLRRWVEGSSVDCSSRRIQRSFKSNAFVKAPGVLIVLHWRNESESFITAFLGLTREYATLLAARNIIKKGW